MTGVFRRLARSNMQVQLALHLEQFGVGADPQFSERGLLLPADGLDAAGKTTLLYKLKLGEVQNTIPTIGFNVEQVEYRNISFTVWDVGGQDKLRMLWRHYYNGVDGLIFVVDSNDHQRVDLAKEELGRLLAAPELENCILLVFANKQDLPNAFDAQTLSGRLGLMSLTNVWYIQPCCASDGSGLYEGLDWMSTALSKKT